MKCLFFIAVNQDVRSVSGSVYHYRAHKNENRKSNFGRTNGSYIAKVYHIDIIMIAANRLFSISVNHYRDLTYETSKEELI